MRDGSGVRGSVVIARNVSDCATHHTIAARRSVARGEAVAAAPTRGALPAAPAGSGIS